MRLENIEEYQPNEPKSRINLNKTRLPLIISILSIVGTFNLGTYMETYELVKEGKSKNVIERSFQRFDNSVAGKIGNFIVNDIGKYGKSFAYWRNNIKD